MPNNVTFIIKEFLITQLNKFVLMKFVDVHAHMYAVTNNEEILKECEKQGITVVNTGTNTDNNLKVTSSNFFALGWWPLEKGSAQKLREQVEKFNPHFIGEIGLDYYRVGEVEKQIKQFKNCLKIAEEFNKPVVVHSRKAESKVLEILEDFDVKVVLHAFSGNKKLIKEGVDKGYYFSIPTIVLKAPNYQNLAKTVPKKQLLTETDSPYLGVSFPNTPLTIPKTVEKIEQLRGEKISKTIINNFKNLLKK